MRKRIVLFAVMMFFALSTTVFATYAWVKTNVNTVGDGPTMNASSSTNIIIFSSPENINWNDPFSLELVMPENHTITRFVPATHTDSSPTLLKYVANVAEVDGSTGLKSSVGSLTFENVIENENSRFYVDYTFYIASYGLHSLDNATLTASLLNSQDRESYAASSSIDFYVNDVFKDTLNIAGYDSVINNYTATKTTAQLGTLNIPVYTDENIIKITLRCYFDGALLKSNGYTFVTQDAIKSTTLSQIDLSVRFSVSGGTLSE